jgi:uncharacterized membrane protein
VSLDDWILALHLVSAFAFMAAVVSFWALVVALRRVDTPGDALSLFRPARVFAVVVAAGSVGTLVFGVWLAISLDAYHVWDGWVIAAIVLWLAAGGAGQRAGAEYQRAEDRARELASAGASGPSAELAALVKTGKGVALHGASTVAAVLILLDMIWKPGA